MFVLSDVQWVRVKQLGLVFDVSTGCFLFTVFSSTWLSLDVRLCFHAPLKSGYILVIVNVGH